MREVKIEKAGNGYIVKFLDFSGGVSVFKTFAEMMDFLFDHFDEQKVKP